MFFFFFFKQKTAYEMLRSLVGSEMCIRDRGRAGRDRRGLRLAALHRLGSTEDLDQGICRALLRCLLQCESITGVLRGPVAPVGDRLHHVLEATTGDDGQAAAELDGP